MSGRTKKTLYYVASGVCFAAALAACVLMDYAAVVERGEVFYPLLSFLLFCGVQILFAPCVLVHECGHLFFGLFARMKAVSVRVGWLAVSGKKVRFSFSSVAGKTEFLPMGQENVRKRMMAVSLGGITFNFLFGIVFSVLFFTLPVHPVLLFFELFAPFHLYEGVCALLPAELPAGRTDGALFRILKNDTPEARNLVVVLTVQGILSRDTFDAVDGSLLFGLPVVREDEPAFLSLLHLRWQYLMWKGEIGRADEELKRLKDLSEYLGESDRAQVICDALFMRRITEGGDGGHIALPASAQGTCAYYRAQLVWNGGDPAQYQKTVAEEPATGIRDLETMFLERFIQNF